MPVTATSSTASSAAPPKGPIVANMTKITSALFNTDNRASVAVNVYSESVRRGGMLVTAKISAERLADARSTLQQHIPGIPET